LAEEGRRTKRKGSKSTSTSEESGDTSMENSNSTRGRSKGGDTLHQGRTTSQGGSEGISQDSEGGDGIAITDNQSASGDAGETTINEVKSEMGGNIDGPTSGVVLTELYTTSDSRNDELRLLGNGVVPQTCTKAFVVLFDKLMNEGRLKEEQGVLSL
jgi:hypothetical protein